MKDKPSNWQILLSLTLVHAILFGPAPVFAQTNRDDGKGVGVKTVSKLPSKDKRWALIIGIDNYERDISPLYGTVNDAKALRDALIKYAGFPENQIILMTTDSIDPELKPNRGNIIDQLDRLSRQIPADGLILFSFSGHGISIGNDAFLIPSDGRIYQNAELMRDRSIDVLRVKRAIQATKVKQVIMFLDACRNDPVKGRGETANTLTEAYKRGFNFDTKNKEIEAYATLYATSFGDRAFEFLDRKTNRDRGYFSYAIEEGLQGAAANENGEVTLGGLIKYIESTVSKRVRVEKNQRQIPYPTTEGFRNNELILAITEKNGENASGSGETTFWQAIENSTEASDFEDYLNRIKNGEFSGIYKATAELKLRRLKNSSTQNQENSGPNTRTVAVDEFGQINSGEMKARLDSLIIQLQNEPDSRGVFINYGTETGVSKRESDIRTYLRIRSFDESRLVFIRGGKLNSGLKTEVYLVPVGGELPTPRP